MSNTPSWGRMESGGAARRFGRALGERFTVRRLVFAFAICALVSTQALFQPLLYQAFSLELLLRVWLDYLIECLLMGLPILLALTLAEVLGAGRSRATAAALIVLGLFAGAFAGAIMLIPFYDLEWDSIESRRFWGDMLYWMVIGGGVAAIHGFQQRAAAAAATLHQARVDQVALSKQMLEARLQVMRAQIEPHFLFNTLANVKRLCQSHVDGGITMLDNLVRYLRAALPRMRDEQSTLAQEAELVQSYLAVLKIRMGARLRYSIDVPPALGGQPFPPMMLLTLAENAIKHGLNPSSTGGSIAIRAVATRSGVEVRVSDSGVGFGAAATGGTGVGLSNTRARLAAIHGDAAELEFMANEPTGVIAVIRVPFALTGTRPAITGAAA
jgi:Histidine kinase/Histidine kinase-, DNA gyrase B-, and HSP90-like ATPase